MEEKAVKQNKFKNFILLFKKIFNNFPITMIVIDALTIFLTIVMDSKVPEDLIERVVIFCVTFGGFCFLVESFFDFKNNKRKATIGYIVRMLYRISFYEVL